MDLCPHTVLLMSANHCRVVLWSGSTGRCFSRKLFRAKVWCLSLYLSVAAWW